METVDALHALLRAEREAILSGNLDKLAETEGRKEALIEALIAKAPTPESLDRIRREAAELLTLLDAAKRGMAAARARLEEQDAARAGLSTYGPEGRNRTVGAPASKVGGRF